MALKVLQLFHLDEISLNIPDTKLIFIELKVWFIPFPAS